MKISAILSVLNDIAPLELAEPWDNVGLLAGSADNATDTALCALELSEAVLDEAIACGAGLIVTHHPILFRGRKSLTEDDPEGRLLCRLIRANIALYAMHTNFDNAHPGVNDALAKRLGLADIEPLEHGLCLGSVQTQAFETFRGFVENALGGVARGYGAPEKSVQRVAVLGGSGGDFAPMALEAGADCFITGEIGYHKALDAVAGGLNCLECGHAATEAPAVDLLVKTLGARVEVNVIKSQSTLYL